MNTKVNLGLHVKINNRIIGNDYPTYFIADIAANHDGNLNKAIKLIREAKKAGADAAKFQHFNADTIVSDYSFKNFLNNYLINPNGKKCLPSI